LAGGASKLKRVFGQGGVQVIDKRPLSRPEGIAPRTLGKRKVERERGSKETDHVQEWEGKKLWKKVGKRKKNNHRFWVRKARQKNRR